MITCANRICAQRGTELRRKDGGLIVVRLHLRYLSLPGPADALEGVVEDVTELRALERNCSRHRSLNDSHLACARFNNVHRGHLGYGAGQEQKRSYPKLSVLRAFVNYNPAAAADPGTPGLRTAPALQPRPVDLNGIAVWRASSTRFIDKSIEIKVVPGCLPR